MRMITQRSGKGRAERMSVPKNKREDVPHLLDQSPAIKKKNCSSEARLNHCRWLQDNGSGHQAVDAFYLEVMALGHC